MFVLINNEDIQQWNLLFVFSKKYLVNTSLKFPIYEKEFRKLQNPLKNPLIQKDVQPKP